jgi:hypothetical protein
VLPSGRQAEGAAASAIADPFTLERLEAVGEPDGPDALLVFADPAILLASRGVDAPAFPIRRLALGVLFPAVVAEESEEIGSLRGELVGELLLSSPREAALFGRLSRLFVLGLVRALGLDGNDLRSGLTVAVEDRTVLFRGVPVEMDQLIPLIAGFAEVP